MAWGYVICNLAGRTLKIKVPTYLALLTGAIPDFDIYFLSFGVPHHELTHSIIFWAPIFLIAIFFFGKRSLPYSAGVFQHLIGDALVGTVPLLLPFSSENFGLSLGVQGRNEVVFEVGMLLVATLIAYRNGDLRSALSIKRKNILMVLPLIALISLTLLFANETNVQLIDYGFASLSLIIIAISHILLACFLAFSTLQGIRGFTSPRINHTVS
jgi:membrane-bound metal-dependent hydrolase YbcI (DUF457 family)